MRGLDLNEIIKCLGEVAKILHDKPREALKELRELGNMIDSQVPYRDGHTLRVSEYSLRIGRELGLTDRELVVLEASALLHDFGKIGIDEAILLKPSSLTDYERKEIQYHVLKGHYMLQGFAELEEVIRGVRSHHEHYNGEGYPNGIAKERIPLIGRIIAVTDSYDAMTHDRPYRKAKTKEAAIKELERCSGAQFDPKIIKVFTSILEKMA